MPICGTDLTVQTTMFSAYGHFPCIKQTIPKTAQSKGLFEAEIKDKNLKVSINLEVFILVRLTGIEPAATRRRRPVLYPLSYKRISRSVIRQTAL